MADKNNIIIVVVIAIFAIGIFALIPNHSESVNIPPTPAFSRFITDLGNVFARNYTTPVNMHGNNGIEIDGNNLTKTVLVNASKIKILAPIITSNVTVHPTNYSTPVTYKGLKGIVVYGSDTSKTIYFNATAVNGTIITPITCALNFNLHSVTTTGVFTCAIDNGTITINGMARGNFTIVRGNQYTQISNNTSNGKITITPGVITNNVVDVYDTKIADYTTPTNAIASSSFAGSTNTFYTPSWNTTTSSTDTGLVKVAKFTGLTPNRQITAVGLQISAAAGNVRVKVYQDDGNLGEPKTLLGESGSISVPGTGWREFSLTVPAVIPASGNVWAGWETDNNALITFAKAVGVANSTDQVAHTYGSGPNPFGVVTGSTTGRAINIVVSTSHTPNLAIDNNVVTYWESNNEVNPWIYVDTGSAQLLSSCAMYWNSTSTSTQILIQTSTDTINWNTKRTVNTNLLTNNAWNFIRWDLDNSTERYVRFYGNDGSAKELSFYELKVLIPSSTSLLLRHGHEYINATNSTLSLGQ